MKSTFQTVPTQRRRLPRLRLHVQWAAQARAIGPRQRGDRVCDHRPVDAARIARFHRDVPVHACSEHCRADGIYCSPIPSGRCPPVINDPSTSNSNNLGSIWNAATLLAAPNDLKANGGVILTSICDTGNNCGTTPATCVVAMIPPSKGVPQIAWTRNASWMTKSSSPTRITSANPLPKGWPFYAGDSATAVEVFYTYTPFAMTAPFWTSAPGTQTIYKVVYVRQRSGLPLTLTPAS